MSFAPPPDYSKIYLALGCGLALGFVIYASRVNQLPHVGDNTHNLPHGGQYCDGNKRVLYSGPKTGSAPTSHLWPFITVIALTLAILLTSRSRRRVCIRCSQPH
uniref:Triple gene block 2 protein n=1 Tax=Shallot virus X TaxID=31770 RepID=A0A6M2VHW2_SHVX|nr:triple gene block 2 protein [Shallot virus X]